MGSGGVVGVFCGTCFKITLVVCLTAIVVALMCALIIVSPIVFIGWWLSREKKKTYKVEKEPDVWSSGKSVDEILEML